MLSLLIGLLAGNGAYASCDDYLSWSDAERRSFLIGWMTGTAMITSNQRLNFFSKRIQQAVKERHPCVGGDCEIVSRAHYAIQAMRSNYRDGLLASLHRDDFYAAVDDYCDSPYGSGTSLTEAIPAALGNMARTGDYTLMSFGIVLNGEERIAEMYSSQYAGGTLSGGRSIAERTLAPLCESKSSPVTLQGQDSLSISVGDEITLDQIHLDAFDYDGKFVSGVPLRIREISWLENARTIESDYDGRYMRIRALQAGEIEFEAISLCPQDPQAAKTFRLIISESQT
ncbi:MAG: hypothetical protein AAFX56_02795 [Pseudomonadota bacterium]